MERRSQVACVRVYPLSIPLRRAFAHAAHVHRDANPIVVQVELADGTVGSGETLPRPYVSGETTESVVRVIRDELLGELLTLRPARFPEALERIDALPMYRNTGEAIVAARAGVELALLDAYSRHFHKPISEVIGWFGLPGLGSPGSLPKVRYSGILAGGDRRKLAWATRLMYAFGLRDFKLKVGFEDDEPRIRAVANVLGRTLGRHATLRLDANGGWTVERAIACLTAVADIPIACVEQPFAPGCESENVRLKHAVKTTIMLDESLLTPADAERCHGMGALDGLNLRVSKNGGFMPVLRLAHFARKHRLLFQLGCMVGETSLLSAVGRRFLEHVPGVRFAEGSYGRFLLTADIVRRPVGFGYGGKPKPLPGLGWGVEVDRTLLDRHTRPGMIEFPL